MNVISHWQFNYLTNFSVTLRRRGVWFFCVCSNYYVQKDEEIFSFSFVVLVLARKQNPHLNSVDFSRCSVTNKKADEEDG